MIQRFVATFVRDAISDKNQFKTYTPGTMRIYDQSLSPQKPYSCPTIAQQPQTITDTVYAAHKHDYYPVELRVHAAGGLMVSQTVASERTTTTTSLTIASNNVFNVLCMQYCENYSCDHSTSEGRYAISSSIHCIYQR